MNKPTLLELSRSQKILLSLYNISKGSNRQVRFEDIAVAAFKTFPSDFHLKGYPEYPDTGDLVHKPLYSSLKKDGYLLSGNKYFSLTPKGVEYVKKLLAITGDTVSDKSKTEKLTVDVQKELERIFESPAFALYSEGKNNDILDIDFYSYLGVTVRTNKQDFLGRLSTVEDAIEGIKNRGEDNYKMLREFHSFMLDKFKPNLEFVKNSKGGKR